MNRKTKCVYEQFCDDCIYYNENQCKFGLQPKMNLMSFSFMPQGGMGSKWTMECYKMERGRKKMNRERFQLNKEQNIKKTMFEYDKKTKEQLQFYTRCIDNLLMLCKIYNIDVYISEKDRMPQYLRNESIRIDDYEKLHNSIIKLKKMGIYEIGIYEGLFCDQIRIQTFESYPAYG